MKKIYLSIALLASMSLTGCATSRGLIQLPAKPPVATSNSQQSSQHTAIITLVEDDRVFEEAPKTPDIPSLKGGLAQATQDEKARAVARKRNGYGQALGDILLQEGSVSQLVQQRVERALNQAGYQVLPNTEANKATANLVLTVKINKFWSWFQPGFSSIKIHSEIDSDLLNNKTSSQPIHIYSKVTNSAQIANGTKWIANINQVLDDYEAQLITELKKQP
ncbi:YajG family lipoprotein [Acinetobacter sp. ME22]|uniref:YajG family lipoprotein n=1 Tax=Acinetobacter sp. ME22 TaxID=2904802 RepID=UPI001EDA3D44|nr:YajG family lipoprotein [Acinetobacter sp. ME22]MCG2574308.1 YajG family lipoprotein [Acinetobacter sp. ME22]